ncbi:MAG: hypothetical protein ACI91T_002596 [Natronomonas sp.]|jgi:hypothetical protein
MSTRALQRAHLLPAVVFVAAVLVLAVQLLTPSPVVVSVGESGTEATTIGQYFTYVEVSVVAVAAAFCGGSGTYLLLHDRARASAEHPRRSGDAGGGRPRAAGDGGVTTIARRPDVPAGSDDAEAVEERWRETLDRLANNEEVLYELLVDADGELPQRTLVEETELSKATVSRTLDSLEQRGLVERRRDGMGNTVLLT